MGPSRPKAGFTLIELMVVVSIVSIALLAFMPSFIHAMADRRAATASMELVRIGRRARAESIGQQRAMLMYLSYGVPPLRSSALQLLRGNSIRCDIENWAQHSTNCAASDGVERGATSCMESVFFTSTHWYHAPYVVTMGMWGANQTPVNVTPATIVREVGAGSRSGTISICYEPSGLVRWSTAALALGTAMNFSLRNAGVASGGGLLFATGLIDVSTRELVNVPRVALFPLAAAPRRLR
jgi:prepilin-type N-terminal cleavage/methylation domain-containing protein